MDDKSVQAGGQQRIITIDGYSMPLVCKAGLMYLKFQGIPTDKDVQTYSAVHLTSPQEWDPLDYVHPKDNGGLTHLMIQLKNFNLILLKNSSSHWFTHP